MLKYSCRQYSVHHYNSTKNKDIQYLWQMPCSQMEQNDKIYRSYKQSLEQKF